MVTWQLTIDCKNPSRMVDFWAPALGYEAQPPPDGFATMNEWYLSLGVPEDELDPDGDGSDRIQDPAGEGPRIWFQPVPESKSVKNRLHLDIMISGGRDVPLETRKERVDAKVAELVAAGATVIRRDPEDVDEPLPDRYARTMQDPEGNEFCVA
jgi:hypothetical protein